MAIPGPSYYYDDGSDSPLNLKHRAAMAKIASIPKLTTTGFPIPKQPTPEDLIQRAVEADLPAPDSRIVQAVNRAASAANFDAKAMLADTEFRKRAALANPSDANAIAQAIIEARAANPALQAPLVTNTGAISQIEHVLGTIAKAEPSDPHPSIHSQVLKVAESAGFSGLDLINLASFRDAVATVAPTDSAAISRAIAINVAAHPELRTTADSWLDLTPEPTPPTLALPQARGVPDVAHAEAVAKRQEFNARMLEKARLSIGNGPVNFQRDAGS